MILRSCLLFLILFVGGELSAARRNYRQTSRLLMRTPTEHVGNVLIHRQFVQHNIVARDFLPARPLWEFSLRADFRKQDSCFGYPLFQQESQKYAALGRGEYNTNDRTYFGDFCLSYGVFGVLRGTKTPTPELFYPYLVLDTTPSAATEREACLSFGHIWRTRQWVFGVAGKFRAQERYAKKEIRLQTKGVEFALREGVYIWVDDYWLGQWASFTHYWQWNELHSQSGEQPFYRHLGFGLWNWDRTFVSESISFDNKTGQVAAGLQVAARDDGFVADVHGAHRWASHADKAYWAAASLERQDLRARLGYRKELGEYTTELLADILLQNRTGVEHFYDSVGRRGNKRYERLFSSPMYTNATRLMGISLASEHPIGRGYAWGSLWGGYGLYRSKYENPENRYRNTYWRTDLELGYWLREHAYWFAIQLRGTWQMQIASERNFSRHVRDPLKSTFLLPTLALSEASRVEAELQLDWGYKWQNAFVLVAAPHVGIQHVFEVGNAFYGGVTLRIQKE